MWIGCLGITWKKNFMYNGFLLHCSPVIMRHRKSHSNVHCEWWVKWWTLKIDSTLYTKSKIPIFISNRCKKRFLHHHYLKNHHDRCKMRPAEDKETESNENPKQKGKSSCPVEKSSGKPTPIDNNREQDNIENGNQAAII